MSLNVDMKKSFPGFSLTIKFDTEGKPIGFLGASGCGKSLTLKSIAGIITPESGKIILNDRVLYDSERKINLKPQQRKIGYMFQNYALFPHMTVRENIEIVIEKGKNKKAITDKMISLFRLGSRQNCYPNQMSGGEQQRVALARMIAYEPELMLFDEPFSALDSFLKDQLQQELRTVLKEVPCDILMVSHNRDELYRFCEIIMIIHKGQIIEVGERENIFTNTSDVAAARLTGCKNISRIIRLSDHVVRALDWDMELYIEKYVEEDIRYIGIRAHNIKACNDSKMINSIPAVLDGVSEGPFDFHIILNSNQKNPGCRLWWIISKQEWKEVLKEKLPERVCLPKEYILPLRDITGNKSLL